MRDLPRVVPCNAGGVALYHQPPINIISPAPLDYLELWIDFCSAQAASPSIASRGVFGSETRPLVPPGEAGEMKTVWVSPGWIVQVHHRLRKPLTYLHQESTEMCGFKAAIRWGYKGRGGLGSWGCGWVGGRAILTIRAPIRTDRRALWALANPRWAGEI